jgi:hypothetical protein
MKTLAREADREEIRRRVRRVRPETPARWGRMSADRMVCHLADALRMALDEKVVRAAPAALRSVFLKGWALYLPMPWPSGIPTSPEIDQEIGGTRPSGFEQDVSELLGLLSRLEQKSATLEGRVHPTFGPMSQVAWLRWGYLHTDHHLRQFGV